MKILISLLMMTNLMANTDFIHIEQKVKTDLDSMISRVLEKDDFYITVNTSTSTRMVKEIIEGESVSVEQKGVDVPPLPGFEVNRVEVENPKREKEKYRFVEKVNLQSVNVQASLNSELATEKKNQVRTLISNYLRGNYPRKSKLLIDEIPMIKTQSKQEKSAQLLKGIDNWILWSFVAGVTLLLLVMALVKMLRSAPKTVHNPQVLPRKGNRGEQGETTIYPKANNPEGLDYNPMKGQLVEGNAHSPLLLDEHNQQLPALPSSEKYIDMRTELLKAFSENSEIFRVYFHNLDLESKSDIVAALRGPAFNSLLRTLNIKHDIDEKAVTPPTEDRLGFLLKDFKEFIEIHDWQNGQFFGFLHQLTQSQLVTLFKDQHALVAALMLKYVPTSDAAKILDNMESSKRIEIITESSRVDQIPAEELQKIESMVRESVETLPKIMLEANNDETGIWSEILAMTEKQDDLLMDLEKIRPELYPSLAKYRFKIEELPTLPTPLISKVLNDIDNEALAKAFTDCPTDVVEFALNEVPPKRRDLIESQIVSFKGLPMAEISEAKKSLVLKFREVMA